MEGGYELSGCPIQTLSSGSFLFEGVILLTPTRRTNLSTPVWCVPTRRRSPNFKLSKGIGSLHWQWKKKIFLMYKEIQMGSVAKSYMRRGFLIYEETRKYLVIYEEAVSHIWLCNRSHLNFLTWGKFCFLFYQCSLYTLCFQYNLPGVLGAGDRGEGNDGGVQGVHRQVVILRFHLPTPLTKW